MEFIKLSKCKIITIDSLQSFDQSLKEKIDIYKKLYDTANDDNVELIRKISAMEIEVCICVYFQRFSFLFHSTST